MAWIKLLTTFLQAPALVRIRRHLGTKKERAAWLALQWLCYLDEHTTNGQTGMLPEEIDDLFGQRNFTAALLAATWAKQEADGTISALDYELHNGENTKKRLMQSIYDSHRAQKKSKKQSGTNPLPNPDCNPENPRTQSGKSQTQIWKIPDANLDKRREEKRREDNIQPSTLTQRSINHHRQNDCNAHRNYEL